MISASVLQNVQKGHKWEKLDEAFAYKVKKEIDNPLFFEVEEAGQHLCTFK